MIEQVHLDSFVFTISIYTDTESRGCCLIIWILFNKIVFHYQFIRDAGPKCPLDNKHLSESQVCTSILNYCCHDISAVNGYLGQKFGPCILWLAKVAVAVNILLSS